MEERRSLDRAAYLYTLFFCFCFGLQAISLKAVSGEVSPVMQIALRSCLGSVLVLCVMRLMGEQFSDLLAIWKPGLFCGLLFALEYVMMGEAIRLTTAARATVFMYTAPLWAALILHFVVASERLSKWQWCGVFIAFTGIVAAFWEEQPGGMIHIRSSMLAGDILALLSGLFWGLSTALVRTSRLKTAPIGATTFYHLMPTFVVLFAAATMLGQMRMTFTFFGVFNLFYQTMIIAFGGFLLWFWLLRTYKATRLSILSFLTPLFTVVFAILLLNEPVRVQFIIGALLVVGGLIVMSLSKDVTSLTQKKLEINFKNE